MSDVEVKILDNEGRETERLNTFGEGVASVQLPEYTYAGSERINSSLYTVFVGKKKKTVTLNRDLEVIFLKSR